MMAAATLASELDEILRAGGIRSVYQPIVDLADGSVVAYEALARGPEGSALERPDLLFLAAREAGRLDELDWECRGAAVRGALEAGFGPPLTLFANVEPAGLTSAIPPHLHDVVAEGAARLRIVVEVTERAIADRPADLLTAAAAIRAYGWGLAVDDLGADARSLALMPFLRPDVVKLDLRLVRDRPDAETAAVVSAVNAHTERTGAAILAEGIETEAHVEAALAMGATLGQGWFFGRPGPLPSQGEHAVEAIPFLPRAASPEGETPFDVLAPARRVRLARAPLLHALSRRLEAEALSQADGPVVLASFQKGARFDAAARRTYAELASHLPLVAALGVGMPAEPAPGVRGASLAPDDPLRGVWSVSVVGPRLAVALAARELPTDENGRLFEYAVTHDPGLAVHAAETLLRRIVPR